MENINKLIRNRKSMQSAILIITIIALSSIITIVSPVFLTARNLMNILLQVSVLGTVTAGMSMVMISGGIDLSVGAMISMIGSVSAVLISRGINELIVIIIALSLAMLAGALSGFIISMAKAEPFIITLGMMSVFSGIALVVTKGSNVGLSSRFSFAGRGSLGIIPIPVLVLIISNLIIAYVLRYLKFGRKIYSIGGNEETSFLAGINIKRDKIIIYMMNGLVVGAASLILLSRLGSASPIMGTGFEMQSIAAAVIGGIALAGGRGNIFGSFLGVLLLGIMSNSLNIIGVPSFFQNIILGLIIIVAVVISKLEFKQR